VHISVGDIFRWNVQNHTKLGAQVRRTMNAGDLVSDDLVESVVRERLDQHDWNYGLRHRRLPAQRPAGRVLHGELRHRRRHPPGDPRRRGTPARAQPPALPELRHGLQPDLRRPEVEGCCDICGTSSSPRPDDTPEALDARLRDYTRRPGPVLSSSVARRSCTTWTRRPRPDEVQACQSGTTLDLPPYKS
jgi:adenylate kinase